MSRGRPGNAAWRRCVPPRRGGGRPAAGQARTRLQPLHRQRPPPTRSSSRQTRPRRDPTHTHPGTAPGRGQSSSYTDVTAADGLSPATQSGRPSSTCSATPAHSCCAGRRRGLRFACLRSVSVVGTRAATRLRHACRYQNGGGARRDRLRGDLRRRVRHRHDRASRRGALAADA